MTPKFAQLRGDFALMNLTRGETVFTPVFDATTGSLTPTVSTEKVPGTGNKRGTIYTYETDRTLSLAITAKSRHKYMLEQYLLGASKVVPEGSNVTFDVPALKQGQIVELPAKNITDITLTGLVNGVDYELFAKTGVIQALKDTVAAAGCTLDHGEYDEIGVFSADAQRFAILFFSEATGQSYKMYNGLLVPSGDFSLVQESGIGEGQVTFELSEATNVPVDPLLGRWGRAYNVD
jgi:hypothetical protein